ncbi:MAG: WD40 repeat domain-containing protein [Candidatus Eremiobacteraeota bacterium]|nr:WD40 repeat domain-containing protein [Candidatus Eremiobacteraeota bacterium]
MARGIIPFFLFLALLTAGLEARNQQGDSTYNIESIAFSPSMKVLAAGGDGGVFLWDMGSGKLLHRFEPGTVALTPDGKTAASGTYGEVSLHELPSGKMAGKLKGPGANLHALAYSPDGSLLAGGFGDGTVWLWDTRSRTRYAVHTIKGTPVEHVAFSPDGTLLAGCGFNNCPRVWDLAGGRALELSSPGEPKPMLAGIKAMAFSPDSRTIACCYAKTSETPNTIVIWDARKGGLLEKFSSGDRSERESIDSIAWSPDGRFLATGFDGGSLYLWDAKNHSVQSIQNLRANHMLPVAFSKDGRVLAAGAKNMAVLIDPESGQVLQTLSPEPNYVYTLAFSPDGTCLVAGSVDGALRMWDMESGELKKILLRHTGWISCFTWLSGSPVMASGSPDGTLRLWEFPSGKHLRALVRKREAGDGSFSQWLDSLAALPDGTAIAAAYYDGSLLFWDRKTGREKSRAKADKLHTLAALPAIRAFALGGSSLSFLDEEGMKPELPWAPQPDPVYVMAASPGGNLLAAASLCGAVRIWDALSGALRCTIGKGDWCLNCLDFSPGGKSLAGAGDDNLIHLWDTETSKETALFRGHSDAVRSACFSPDGKSLASGGDDGTVRLWDISTKSQVRSFPMTMLKPSQ